MKLWLKWGIAGVIIAIINVFVLSRIIPLCFFMLTSTNPILALLSIIQVVTVNTFNYLIIFFTIIYYFILFSLLGLVYSKNKIAAIILFIIYLFSFYVFHHIFLVIIKL